MKPKRSKDKSQMWVSLDFHNKLKAEAAKAGLPILEYTRQISKDLKFDEEDKRRFKPLF